MITYSTETLHHFLCSICEKRWSIADWQPQESLTCPHCGNKHHDIYEMEE